MSEWSTDYESNQQRLDAPGSTYWLSDDKGWTVTKVTVDAAGPNASKPKWFPTEQRAKNWIELQVGKGE